MTMAQMIRQHGFRKWYERELVLSHLHLVLLVLSLVGLLGSAEAYERGAPLLVQAWVGLCAAASAAIGLWALRRYLALLMHAEHVAHQAQCPACHAYARWSLIDEDQGGQRLQVQCQRCGHRWHIDG
ncbi:MULTISPECIES: MJ0042-type zinc finger domain-containing protein [Caldimonas]|jgi:predicted Zn finger-like uncharacterized protein|uniref:MJ0042-type zinc finger domain-containing protein n=1 Tax=Caldimonas TaxID=196013 RepID=UPI00036ACC81|nr:MULTISPECIES: MJ0042-type zinc finger domain-containing protein [Caldimonas]MCX7659158.1 hypothetical protein [Caldimonas manganoxidans]GIX23908.1 MAG: hypothetical protein KatS3mg122_1139 [Caldimonas sp.]